MRTRREDATPRPAHFGNDEHALASGIVLGALLKASGESNAIVKDARPFMDGRDYTNQILVRIGDRHYTLTVDEATAEALRE